MFKRYYIIVCTMLILSSCAACENKFASPIEQSDGTFLWDGLRLIREDIVMGWGGANIDVAVPENVLTTKEQSLTVSFKSRGGVYEYGFNEYIQVYLDGSWYSLSQELSQNDEPLILDTFQGAWIESEDRTEHTVDLSVIGELPPGKYRLIEAFYEEKFKETNYAFANFWVIKPGGNRPPESETTGKARKEDIILYVQSPYEARRDITDKDAWFFIIIENLSGKKYCLDNPRTEKNPPILERQQNGQWENIAYPHANVGLIDGWLTDYNQFFLYDPLTAGRYRVRVPMYILYEPNNNMEIIYEFDVTAHETAQEPKWEISRLKPSPYDTAIKNTGVIMTLTNPMVNKDNKELEITLTADKLYNYGEPYEVEALIDSNWYGVPFSSGGFTMPEYTFDPDNAEISRVSFSCNPVFACGILPAGHYRIIKEFTIPNSSTEGGYLAIEFAAAEFTVEEALGSEDVWIDKMHELYK